MNSNAEKGKRAEREAAALISEHLGFKVKRRYNLGTQEDIGDLIGVPEHIVQVAAWKDLSRALRVKPVEAGNQAANAGVPFAATFLRLHGGEFRVVLTVEQWATLTREALS